jgi:hypothetical protein
MDGELFDTMVSGGLQALPAPPPDQEEERRRTMKKNSEARHLVVIRLPIITNDYQTH